MDTEKNSNGPEKDGKQDEKAGNKTGMGEKVKRLIAKEPQKNLLQIGKELKRLGILTNERSIYKIVKTDVNLQRDIEEIRELNAAKLSKNIVPLALKETERALKDKNYDREKKFKWSKLALDKEFGTDDSKRQVPQQQVNIQAIQTLIYNDLTKEEDEQVVDITEKDN